MPHSPKPRMPKASKTKHLRTARKRFDGTVDNEPFISFGTEVCHDLVAAEKREWLVTNGIGGFGEWGIQQFTLRSAQEVLRPVPSNQFGGSHRFPRHCRHENIRETKSDLANGDHFENFPVLPQPGAGHPSRE